MDEAKRILRYILPGMAYVILLMIMFFILEPREAKKLFLELRTGIDLGEVLVAFVFSGGLGYMFSIIFFGCMWLRFSFGKAGHIYNHLDLLTSLIDSGKLRIIEFSTGDSKEEKFELKDGLHAWYILNVAWHGQTKTSQFIEGIDAKFNPYYSDVTTALATTLTGSIFSLITFLILVFQYYFTFTWPIFWCFFIYVCFIFFCWIRHRKMYKIYQAVINTAFATEIHRLYKKTEEPVEIIFSKKF
jgi:hypothetical protein